MAGLAGCASETFAPDTAPELMAARNNAPLYQLGPNQFGPPEALLEAGERVRMLRREFGYSRVQLASGMSGYMANEDLAVAPPLPPPPPPGEAARVSRSSSSPPDLPPVEVDLPDLDEEPADAPALD